MRLREAVAEAMDAVLFHLVGGLLAAWHTLTRR